MTASAIGTFVGIAGVLIGILGFVANRRASRVLAARIEGESYLDGWGWRVTRYCVAGATAEHWKAAAVRVTTPESQVAPYIPTGEDDGHGNPFYGPGSWAMYLRLSDYPNAIGIVSKPADKDTHLDFTLQAKSDPSITIGSPFAVKAQQPAGASTSVVPSRF